MHSETEQLLATLEVLRNPSCTFVWETEEQGEFNVWNLMISEGFVTLTDVDVAIAHWQSVERWGTPTEQSKNFEYAPPRNERKDGWNAEIEEKRSQSYQKLLQLLKSEFQDMQAFKLNIYYRSYKSLRWEHPSFCFYIIVGKTDENWLCFSPIVPNEVTSRRSKQPNSELAAATDIQLPNAKTLSLQSKIHSILSEFPPIKLYGYYYGGYNYTYEHQIVYSGATKKAVAVEQALQAAEMLTVEKTNVEYALDESNSRKLSQFFNKKLSDRTIYNLSFWDIGYTYEIGQTPTGDWLGVRSLREFEYNP